jgi:hypothetical protein
LESEGGGCIEHGSNVTATAHAKASKAGSSIIPIMN